MKNGVPDQYPMDSVCGRSFLIEKAVIDSRIELGVFLVEGEHIQAAIVVMDVVSRMAHAHFRDLTPDLGHVSPSPVIVPYLDRIRQGKVQTASGRPIPRSEQIPGYCYVICDLTPSIERRCKMHDAIRTSDGLGYFFYKKNYGAYVEVISFDRLVNAAKERNRAFFDKLGLPTT